MQQEKIGDRTPSQFLRHSMCTLAGETVSDEFLRTLWANRLPAMTRAIVTAQIDLLLEKLAAIDDLICDSLPQVANVSEDMDAIDIEETRRTRATGIRTYKVAFARKIQQSARSRRRSRLPASKSHCWSLSSSLGCPIDKKPPIVQLSVGKRGD